MHKVRKVIDRLNTDNVYTNMNKITIIVKRLPCQLLLDKKNTPKYLMIIFQTSSNNGKVPRDTIQHTSQRKRIEILHGDYKKYANGQQENNL